MCEDAILVLECSVERGADGICMHCMAWRGVWERKLILLYCLVLSMRCFKSINLINFFRYCVHVGSDCEFESACGRAYLGSVIQDMPHA
jgi:hypothetical protein